MGWLNTRKKLFEAKRTILDLLDRAERRDKEHNAKIDDLRDILEAQSYNSTRDAAEMRMKEIVVLRCELVDLGAKHTVLQNEYSVANNLLEAAGKTIQDTVDKAARHRDEVKMLSQMLGKGTPNMAWEPPSDQILHPREDEDAAGSDSSG